MSSVLNKRPASTSVDHSSGHLQSNIKRCFLSLLPSDALLGGPNKNLVLKQDRITPRVMETESDIRRRTDVRFRVGVTVAQIRTPLNHQGGSISDDQR